MKKAVCITLEEESINRLKSTAEDLGVSLSELIDSVLEFYFYNLENSRARSTCDEGKITIGDRLEVFGKNSQRKD
jgi:hypothetical protein